MKSGNFKNDVNLLQLVDGRWWLSSVRMIVMPIKQQVFLID
jgi:hypothetical protein